MKIDKSELSKKISQLKGIVPKNTTIEALQGILVKDGYLIASNMELTVKTKLEGIDGENFIIPSKAFDLIGNLPDGELSIESSEDVVTLQMGKIKNKFKTHPADKFSYDRQSIDGEMSSIDAEKLKEAIQHVNYAIPVNAGNKVMEGMYFECGDGMLNLVGLDGHIIAWDSIPFNGTFKLIIPKAAVEKVVSLDLKGEVSISYDSKGALFRTDDYEIYTRLIEGNYFPYQKMFTYGEINTAVEKRLLLEAINRARLCGSMEDKAPVVLDVKGKSIQITYRNSLADYHEEVLLQEDVGEGLKIAFDPKLLLNCLKAFGCENVALSFATGKSPAIIKAEDSDMTALVLPVNIKENA